MPEERIVCIEWSGPHSLEEVKALNDKADCGLYQVYAHHPVYGPGVLVYIGQVFGQTFGGRIPQHNWGSGTENDPENVQVYIGRCIGNVTPSKEQWKKDIDLAEKLLINAHGPAYNSTHIMAVNESDRDVLNVRVLNRGHIRALHREVSSLTWTRASKRFDSYKHYGIAPPLSSDEASNVRGGGPVLHDEDDRTF